ncbi:TlpA disulfide reductase family protein [Winogradskyella sp.]|uniref:TlpA disulfide reductase family protein n=1 Tax=Winogradskyella sp. TaxID=1883156 RepID=UPI002622EFB6|nr:TlpA disulfide reductase family protein [Winogradskyella sp.]
MRKISCVLLILLFISCNDKTENEFSLAGKTNNFENGTMIYLDNADSQNVDLIDSTSVENNSFVFNTKLSNSPLHVVIRTNDDSHYRFLWLENNPMTFDASQNDFENAIVTGSKEELLAQPLRKELETLSEEDQRKKEIEFIKKNPNSIVSVETLSVYSTTYGKEKTKVLFNVLSEENKSSKYGKMIADYIQMHYEPKIGEQFADFEMIDHNGIPKKLSDLKGKTIFLDFWASWCAPCRKENPNLVKTYKKFKPKGLEIFAVSLDENKEKWLNAIEKDKLNWFHVNDLKGQGNKATMIYGVEGIPDSFLIDHNGIIIARDLRGKELDKKLEELLN